MFIFYDIEEFTIKEKNFPVQKPKTFRSRALSVLYRNIVFRFGNFDTDMYDIKEIGEKECK